MPALATRPRRPLPVPDATLHFLPDMDLPGPAGSLLERLVRETLLNYYRDHRDAMGFHSGDEPELGPEPVIASLSLGETRTLVLKHRRRKDLAPVRIPLHSGSLLVMKGATQHKWKHGINKVAQPCGPRVNLTFRRIFSAA